MSNFARVIRLTLQHRLTVVAVILCSLGVAMMWCGGILAVQPIIDGVMLGKSIPQLLDEKLAKTETRLARIDKEIEACRQELATASSSSKKTLQFQLSSLEQQRAKEDFWLVLRRILPTVHRWLPVTPFETLVVILLALGVSTVLKSLFRLAGTYLTARLGHLTAFELRKEFYRRTLRLDLGTFRTASPGDLMNRFTGDVGAAAGGAQVVFGSAVREPLKMIFSLIGAALISWQLLLMTLVIAPLGGLAIYWLAKSLKRANRRALEELSTVYDHLAESFNGIKVIQAFTMESHERSRFHQTSKQFYRRSMKIAFYDSLASPMIETLGIGLILGVVMAGGFLVLNQQTHLFGIRISSEPLSHGALTAFYVALALASDPARRLSGLFNSLQGAAAASDHLYELFDRMPQVVDPPVPSPLPDPIGRIHFRDVSFAYQPDEPVLREVNLQVKPGERVAIVGPNGCGKSTLINLLPRFYDTVQGAVTIGGVDVRDVRIRDLRSHIGIVSQETLLFDDTVADNIRYGSPGASDAEIIAAARRAHAHGFITEKLASGYQTCCGTAGNRLSGGQRQRLALARAILRDPEILILDEATSHIDVESERLIHQVLEKFVQGRTVFMITHRPSTLALADRIVVMDLGRIVDVGTFDELADRCKLFTRLADLKYRESA